MQDAVKQGQDKVIEPQRELEDTARKEAEKVREEEQKLEGAKKMADQPATP